MLPEQLGHNAMLSRAEFRELVRDILNGAMMATNLDTPGDRINRGRIPFGGQCLRNDTRALFGIGPGFRLRVRVLPRVRGFLCRAVSAITVTSGWLGCRGSREINVAEEVVNPLSSELFDGCLPSRGSKSPESQQRQSVITVAELGAPRIRQPEQLGGTPPLPRFRSGHCLRETLGDHIIEMTPHSGRRQPELRADVRRTHRTVVEDMQKNSLTSVIFHPGPPFTTGAHALSNTRLT